MAKLEVKNITKKFGDFYAANNITFTAEEGEFVTLLGPSGCGKTSLLKLIGGFILPMKGRFSSAAKMSMRCRRKNAIPPCVSNLMHSFPTSTSPIISATV